MGTANGVAPHECTTYSLPSEARQSLSSSPNRLFETQGVEYQCMTSRFSPISTTAPFRYNSRLQKTPPFPSLTVEHSIATHLPKLASRLEFSHEILAPQIHPSFCKARRTSRETLSTLPPPLRHSEPQDVAPSVLPLTSHRWPRLLPPLCSNTSRHATQPRQSGTRRPQARARGRDGRFLPKGMFQAECADDYETRVCGWCGTSKTTQWRVGPSNGSVEMSVLCNACGISYRRAITKSDARVDLDRLAREMGPTRPSIQKSLKRQWRQANAHSLVASSANGISKKIAQRSRDRHANGETGKSFWLRQILCAASVEPGATLKVCRISKPFVPTIKNLLADIPD